MARLILVRAGMTDLDEQERIVGSRSIPLSPKGRGEIVNVAQEIRPFGPIDLIFSACGQAAEQSAEVLGEQLGVKVRPLDDLTNMNLGLWEGLQVSEVRRKHKKQFQYWKGNPEEGNPPAGECLSEVLERIRPLLKGILRRATNGCFVLVAPDPLRTVIRSVLTTEEFNVLPETANGTPWEILEIDRAKIEENNWTARQAKPVKPENATPKVIAPVSAEPEA